MNVNPEPTPVVFTNKARCRDCYRCVRFCPVKAIRMHHGQASIDAERCVACGTCVRECPQQAKAFRNDLDRAKRLFAEPGRVACSLAPSFAAAFPGWQRSRLPSALRRLGFDYVGETAIGAYHVAQATAQCVAAAPRNDHVCTACPAVVRFVETYRPHLLGTLVPVVSPMVAHGRHIRRTQGQDYRVVFIGPCVAKKAEAERDEVADSVDVVLTFAELVQWLKEAPIDLSTCEESDFDEAPAGDARLFALEGGAVRTSGIAADLLDRSVLAISGFENIDQILEELQAGPKGRIVEPLFCPRGCVNGPAMHDDRNTFGRREDVLDYAATHPGCRADGAAMSPEAVLDLHSTFKTNKPRSERPISEQRIQAALERIGKTGPQDLLNCGACGYAGCREKAIAVVQGLAEPEMCMPYTRRLAEQRVDRIIETSPNGILILDDRLRILSMNPSFRGFFMCSDAVCGQSISCLMDPEPFERLAAGQEKQIELTVDHKNYHVVCHQILYRMPEEDQYVGIFVNVTKSRANERELNRIRGQTVMQAQELLEQQIRMAETIATCLGENTARGEALLRRLVQMTEDGTEEE
ncbi:MAG: 4Fe-4S binding protein [Pirellulaceae bacterium]|nr:4Fe-4S binding protein [Pirellulaceae bacterium]